MSVSWGSFHHCAVRGTHAAAYDLFHGVNSDRRVSVSVDSVALCCCWVLRVVVCQPRSVPGVSPTAAQ